MPHVAASVRIDAPPEVVFPWLVEPERLARWLGGFVSAEPLTEGGVRVGARSRDVFEEDGRRIEMETEIVELDPPRRLGVRIEAAFMTSRTRYDLEPAEPPDRAGSPATVVRYAADLDFSGWWRVAAPLLGPRLRASADRDLGRLRAAVEADRPTAPATDSPV